MAGVAAHYGVPRRLSTCHTALVQGYVVEGHVPVDVIERLLKEGPEIAGVAVPGMPPGAPGMESETPVHYQIVTFDKSGGELGQRGRRRPLRPHPGPRTPQDFSLGDGGAET